ncbi:MAG: TolC family protein [Planctomycetota bacterium]
MSSTCVPSVLVSRSPAPPRRWRRARLRCCCLLLPAGCGFAAYRPQPLDARATLAEAGEQRATLPDGLAPGQVLTFAGATDRLRDRNAELRTRIAEVVRARAVAAVPTPWLQASLQVGPNIGLGDLDGHRIVPFVQLGLTLPTAGKRAGQDDLLVAQAEVARIVAAVTFRQAWLELRRRWIEVAWARRGVVLRRGVADAAALALQAVRELVEAGAATALDVSLLAVGEARARAEVTAGERDAAMAEAALRELLDVALAAPMLLAEVQPPALPAVPTLDDLRARLVDHHPELLRLRAEYVAAERSLRLEVAQQYPDVTFGPSWGGEVNESYHILGLPLGIDLPLFARNQRGVAAACAARTEARVRYEVACSRALARVERARVEIGLAARRAEELRERVLPLAATGADAARRALLAGVGDALALRQAQRELQEVEVSRHAAAGDLYAAWFALEEAVGCPLLDLGGTSYPRLPDELAPLVRSGNEEDA